MHDGSVLREKNERAGSFIPAHKTRAEANAQRLSQNQPSATPTRCGHESR